MAEERPARRGSFVFPLLLIAIGAVALYSTLRPEVNPWPLVERYWPLLLIFLGLGKLWDHYRARSGAPRGFLSGGEIAVLVVVLALLAGLVATRGRGSWRGEPVHRTETVERRGAESVRVEVEMGAGELEVSGGASQLLDATFDYTEDQGKPVVHYDVSGNRGVLSVKQQGSSIGVHIGKSEASWRLRLANDVPMEMRLEMGAGRGDLRVRGMSLTKLDVSVGAGTLEADLGGDWKKDLEVHIEGGVGTATVRLPKSVGVEVRASGGIGSINVEGLEHRGDVYVNSGYGKSPVTLRVSVEGGVGTINLLPGD